MGKVKYIKYHRKINGTMLFAICHKLVLTSDFSNGARSFFKRHCWSPSFITISPCKRIPRRISTGCEQGCSSEHDHLEQNTLNEVCANTNRNISLRGRWDHYGILLVLSSRRRYSSYLQRQQAARAMEYVHGHDRIDISGHERNVAGDHWFVSTLEVSQ